MSELRSIVYRTYDVFNAREFDAYPELLDQGVELIMAGISVRGLEAVTEFVSVTGRANPGLRVEPLRVVAEVGDTVVTEVLMVDRSSSGQGAASAAACGVYRFRNRRIVEWRTYLDPTGEDLASAALTAVAAEQSALRRVAELVARQSPPDQVFSLVTRELGELLDAHMTRTVRFEPDGTATVLAATGRPTDRLPPGTNISLPNHGVLEEISRTGRPARVDDYDNVGGPSGAALREEGVRSAAGGPIVVDGRLWGAMVVGARAGEALPSGTEERIARFAELTSTAISNVESRGEVERLAAEQSALRRVAELVARHASAEHVFAFVVEELRRLLDVELARAVRFESDGTLTLLASSGVVEDPLRPGSNVVVPKGTVIGTVAQTGAPARLADYAEVRGSIGEVLRTVGARSGTGGPIVVDGRLWGALVVGSTASQTLAPGTEDRVAKFAELLSTAISNLESQAEIARSRARIVEAGDQARRRFERDLHDGVQQRLVSLGLELRAAETTIPAELSEVRGSLSSVGAGLGDVIDALRELSRGLHPAVLLEGGLAAALRALVRRSAVPVELRIDLGEEPLAEAVEVAAYYVTSEALTNTVKHAQASRAELSVGHHEGCLDLVVRDNGIGGADASRGSGLTGLVDRVEALGGTIDIVSPNSGGTRLHAHLPTSSTGLLGRPPAG
jgi:signal transduction histidine kinase/limonene-1,2-epoxide hydrolase